MKIFLSIAAVLAWLFGAGLLLAPEGFYAPLHTTITPLIATIAQAHGATLVGLGTLNWFARNAKDEGLKAVLIGNLVVQILSLAIAIRTFSMVGGGVAPALVIHTVLGSAFALFLFKTSKK